MIFSGLLRSGLTKTWEELKMIITPESHAESVVNEIYSPENRGMLGLPGFPEIPPYERTRARVPQPVVSGITTIEVIGGKIGESASGGLKRLALYLFAAAAALIFINAFFRGRF